MTRNFQRLSFKVSGILIGFSVIAIVAIGLTLLVSWKLQGGAAAINDIGSERMRAYRIVGLLADIDVKGSNPEALTTRTRQEVQRFGQVLDDLKHGDPSRPLFVPQTPAIQAQLHDIEVAWDQEIKPLVERVLAAPDGETRSRLYLELGGRVDLFVARIDAMVRAVEDENAHYTSVLGSLQLGLMAFSLVGAISLVFLVFVVVVRPVRSLLDGMQRVEREDFSARVPVETKDEFGELAGGFNRMADHLQELYRTLEERVATKTRRLEQTNREVSVLYSISTFLNEPATAEELCQGFLRRLMATFQAQAGSVRLAHPDTQDLHMYVSEGLDADFLHDERCLRFDQCLCGNAARDSQAAIKVFPETPLELATYRCQRAGFRTVSALPVHAKKKLLGVFNLYFHEPRTFSREERALLESLGQNLGVALENHRLLSRERELAVSEERNLLAQELHDSIAQSLAFLNLQAQMLDDSLTQGDLDGSRSVLSMIREGIQESYDDVRELLVHFRTRIDQAGMEEAMRMSVERFEAQTGIEAQLHVRGSGMPPEPETRLQVLHIVQEALSNVRKHAGAQRVDVILEYDPAIRITIRDDGRGFDPANQAAQEANSVGLSIMRERAHRVGGKLALHSQPGKGTEVVLLLPPAEAGESTA